jgi:hypothetical protein
VKNTCPAVTAAHCWCCCVGAVLHHRCCCCCFRSPDEEDEELLERAKANRKQRLAAQKETTRDFLREEGVKDRLLDSELLPVQKAVFQLAKSGEQQQQQQEQLQ